MTWACRYAYFSTFQETLLVWQLRLPCIGTMCDHQPCVTPAPAMCDCSPGQPLLLGCRQTQAMCEDTRKRIHQAQLELTRVGTSTQAAGGADITRKSLFLTGHTMS